MAHATPKLTGMRAQLSSVLFLCSLCGALASCSGGESPTVRGQHALPNALRVTEKLWSGGLPEGDAGFDELRGMGIKTIISVDGAAPDVARAKARGMRYVHLPIGYHGIPREQQLLLARAVQELEGPIYLHCHHGKHRSPAAAAVAAIALGSLTPAEGEALLQRAGTAPGYTGLYRCVREARQVGPGVLAALSAELPEVAQTPDFVQAMTAAQVAHDHLAEIRDAGWSAPASHPDLVPLDEAGKLENLLRAMQIDPEVRRYPATFVAALGGAIRLTQELEEAIAAGEPPSRLTARLMSVSAACRSCHVQHRDSKPIP